MKEETEEVWIPSTELTHNRSFLDGLLSLLWKSLIRDFRSIVLHDTNHVTIDGTRKDSKVVRFMRCLQKPKIKTKELLTRLVCGISFPLGADGAHGSGSPKS